MKIFPHEIGFDLDGVIADTAATFIRLACEQHDYCSFTLADITSFHVEDCLDIPMPLVEQIFTDILEDSLGTGLMPMPGAVEVMTTRRLRSGNDHYRPPAAAAGQGLD